MSHYQHETAIVDAGATIGDGTKIWHFAHICSGAQLGRGCILGQNTMVADGAILGDNVKVQNNVAIYTGVTIEDDVFLGPSCVLTNVTNPRSQVVRRGIYEPTRIRRGATICANATIVCGITLGRYAFVAAGAVVTRNLPDYAFARGVPARMAGWMSRHGHLLHFDDQGQAVCPESGYRYECTPARAALAGASQDDRLAARVRCYDLDEESPLPADLAVGTQAYDTFKPRTTSTS